MVMIVLHFLLILFIVIKYFVILEIPDNNHMDLHDLLQG